MEEVEGDRNGSRMYIDEVQFIYRFNNRSSDGTIWYLKCRWDSCPARYLWKDHQERGLRYMHNHLPDTLEVDILRYKSVLRRRARLESTPLQKIFLETQRLFVDAALALGGYESFRSTMYYSRKMNTPPVPTSLEEYHYLIINPRWSSRYIPECGPAGRPFYRGFYQASDGTNFALFISPTVSEILQNNSGLLQMDGTFKVVPSAIGAVQLFTIHKHFRETVFPLVYCLMQRRTKATYEEVFRITKEVLPQLSATSVMADYETALRQAVLSSFPEASLLGCWFHYCRAIYQRARRLELPNLNQQIARAIRMAMALPLLPPNLIARGIDIISTHVGGLEAFVLYLRRWLPLHISVYGQQQRTNNAVESFHRHLMRVMGRPHPNVWAFTEHLSHIENAKACDLIRLQNGVDLPSRRRVAYRRLEKNIQNAQNRLQQDEDVEHFLNRVAHVTRSLQRLFGGPEVFDVEHHVIEEDIEHMPGNSHTALPEAIDNYHWESEDDIPHITFVQNRENDNWESENDLPINNIMQNREPENMIVENLQDVIPPEEQDWLAWMDERTDYNPHFERNNTWEPEGEDVDADDDSDRETCSICCNRKMRFVLICGHRYCGHCTVRMYNPARLTDSKCATCRIPIVNSPIRYFI